jgi:hypothetical protein
VERENQAGGYRKSELTTQKSAGNNNAMRLTFVDGHAAAAARAIGGLRGEG